MPDAKECVGLSTGELFCIDSQGESYHSPTNFLCTDSDGYKAIRSHVLCLQNELEKCYKQPKQCKPSKECGWQAKTLKESRIHPKLITGPQPIDQD